jgi:hypothetical protein
VQVVSILAVPIRFLQSLFQSKEVKGAENSFYFYIQIKKILHYEDQTPPEELDHVAYQAASYQTGKRLSKIGRPTKKQRRDIEGFME